MSSDQNLSQDAIDQAAYRYDQWEKHQITEIYKRKKKMKEEQLKLEYNPNKIDDGSDDFKRTKLTHQQQEELLQKQFWNDFHKKKELNHITPIKDRQTEEHFWLKKGQDAINKRIDENEANDELSRSKHLDLETDIAGRPPYPPPLPKLI